MDIFVHNVPCQASPEDFRRFLEPLLNQHDIRLFECSKPRNKNFGFLRLKDRAQADGFLQATSNGVRFPGVLGNVIFKKSHRDGSKDNQRYRSQSDSRSGISGSMSQTRETTTATITSVVDLISDTASSASDQTIRASQRIVPKFRRLDVDYKPTPAAEILKKEQLARNTFGFDSISCGQWNYEHTQPIFEENYTRPGSGNAIFGRGALALMIHDPLDGSKWTHRVDFQYFQMPMIFTSSVNGKPSLYLSGHIAPKIFRSALVPFEGPGRQRPPEIKKMRVAGLDEHHSSLSGQCLVYRIQMKSEQSLKLIKKLLAKSTGAPPHLHCDIPIRRPNMEFTKEMATLEWLLSNCDGAGELPYCVGFQLFKLARQSSLSPEKVHTLLSIAHSLERTVGKEACAEAVRRLGKDLSPSGPGYDAEEFSVEALENALHEYAEEYQRFGSELSSIKTSSQMKPIHRVNITPTSIYLTGPEPEVTNRVIRRYEKHLESFLRVTFSEEDGNRLETDFNTRIDDILKQFLGILTTSIKICGKEFAFLGFSASSLKSATAWFMSPIHDPVTGKVVRAADVIESLGDFEHFRSPAKCAARIGQAFTDTSNWVTVQAGAMAIIPDIVKTDSRNVERVFSDGCGTISRSVLDKLRNALPKQIKRKKPVAFQIRYQGAKGMVSLDSSLPGDMICIRKSMEKFKAKGAHDIEVCGIAERPLPLTLNRPLIKLLEDLGVPERSFIELQDETLEEIRQATKTPKGAATFLESEKVAGSLGLARLIRSLDKIGINALRDPFIHSVVDATAKMKLREVKYRGRIKVKKGMKLFGIMDETGYLEENEVFCPIRTTGPDGYRGVLYDPSGQYANVVVTRSPALHPGDVQIVKAVNVPTDSPLHHLHNVIVFSKRGERDLPSKLAGGDLDGDQFDIIYDPRLMPKLPNQIPADYPRANPIDIGRPVTLRDIAKHFIEFMENDLTGMLATHHLIIADRQLQGTSYRDCLTLAELSSIAVDYAKTGIKVDRSRIPRWDRSQRPDFMSPVPNVKVVPKHEIASLELDFDDAASEITNEDEADLYAALDLRRKTNYYKSTKVLGTLFRRLDEHALFRDAAQPAGGIDNGTMDRVWRYVQRALVGLQGWDDKKYKVFAQETRRGYEENLSDVMDHFALRHTASLLELEVVCGSTFGAQNRRSRELGREMRDRFDGDVAYVRGRIDAGAEEYLDEALFRAVACLELGLMEPGRKVGGVGGKRTRLMSWKYLAAAVCVEQLRLFYGGKLPVLGGI